MCATVPLNMLKDNAIPIRLDSDTKERLKAVAEKVGLSSSALIRILIVSFVEAFEKSDGRVTLPLQWKLSARAIAPLLHPSVPPKGPRPPHPPS